MPATTIDDLVKCDQCGDRVSDTHPVGDRELCEVCCEGFTGCDRCDQYVDGTSETVSGDYVCSECAYWHYTECQRCELLVDDREVRTAADGWALCESCAENYYWTCGLCGELIGNDDSCSTCDDCDDQSAAGLIYDYGYKPVPRFYGDGPTYLGLELEINAADGRLYESAELATSHLGNAGYLKQDCSINGDTGYGFEIVTHPMSYEWAMNNFAWSMLPELEANGCDAEGNGLHVHVSRDGFASPSHVYRWLQFIYRNSQKVTTLARRVSEQWAAFYASDRQHVKDYAKGEKGHRYRAVNTQNDATFELRVFASSLDTQQVKAALGLVAASVEYARHLSVADIVQRAGWTWTPFVAWLHERPQYTPLVRELEARACAC